MLFLQQKPVVNDRNLSTSHFSLVILLHHAQSVIFNMKLQVKGYKQVVSYEFLGTRGNLNLEPRKVLLSTFLSLFGGWTEG